MFPVDSDLLIGNLFLSRESRKLAGITSSSSSYLHYRIVRVEELFCVDFQFSFHVVHFFFLFSVYCFIPVLFCCDNLFPPVLCCGDLFSTKICAVNGPFGQSNVSFTAHSLCLKDRLKKPLLSPCSSCCAPLYQNMCCAQAAVRYSFCCCDCYSWLGSSDFNSWPYSAFCIQTPT